MSHASRAVCAYGTSRERAAQRAVLNALRKLPHEYNAAELLDVQEQRWFGISWVKVKARACQVQADPILALSPAVAVLSPVLAEPFDSRAMAA
jgi:hypothetical protein